MKPYLIITHKNCLDGTAAAWIAWRKLGKEQVEVIACNYGDPIPDLTDRIVYILDFSFLPQDLVPASQAAKSVTLLDHHEGIFALWTQEYKQSLNGSVTLDKTLSGVGLAWQHFYPKKRMPHLLRCVQDRDLWLFQHPDTKALCAGLMAKGMVGVTDAIFEAYSRAIPLSFWAKRAAFWQELFGFSPEFMLYEIGKIELENRRRLMEEWAHRNARVMDFFGFIVPVCNAPYEWASDIGHYLSQSASFAVIYEDNLSTGLRKYSLRSRSDGGQNVMVIAQALGGGGHEHSAGFYTPVPAAIENRISQLITQSALPGFNRHL